MKLQAIILIAAALCLSIILFAAALGLGFLGTFPGVVKNESTGLRGGGGDLNNDTDELQQQQHRSLLDRNNMVCGEHSARDGSVWCTFRVMPLNAPTLQRCLNVDGSDLCLLTSISVSVPAEPINGIVPAPGSAPNTRPPTPPPTRAPGSAPNTRPPTLPPTRAINSPINIIDSNPNCPPQNQVPATGDLCNFSSGYYYTCDYFTSSALNAPRIQCRCNNDNLFYCRTIDPLYN